MTASFEHPLATEYDEYYTLPKEIGSVSSDELLKIAKYNDYQARRFNNSASVKFDAVAGSTLVEAVLVADHNDLDLQTHLDYLDDAEYHLRLAADGERALLEKGSKRHYDQAAWQHTELIYDFMDVYRDIVCGEITTRTKHEILGKLEKRYAYNMKLSEMGDKKRNLGTAYEVAVLRDSWQHYHRQGDFVAIPSTLRGGNGEFRRTETHDICLALQLDTHEWVFDGREVKGGDGLTYESLVRYDRTMIHMDNRGNTRTFDQTAA